MLTCSPMPTGFARLPITIPGRRRDSPARDDPRPHPGRARRYPTRSTPLTTALATPPAINTAVADLVLVRMTLPSKIRRPEDGARGRRQATEGSDLSAAEFDELRNELASAGFLTKGKRNTFALTDAGRERALRFLGVAELPARTNWSTVIAKYLFPKAAGLSADAAAKLESGDKLAAFILKRKYGLAAGAGSTVKPGARSDRMQGARLPRRDDAQRLVVCGLEQAHGLRTADERETCQAAPAVRDRA